MIFIASGFVYLFTVISVVFGPRHTFAVPTTPSVPATPSVPTPLLDPVQRRELLSSEKTFSYIDLSEVTNAEVANKPFAHFVAPSFVPPAALAAVNQDFPPLLKKNKHVEAKDLWQRGEIFGAFKGLLDELQSNDFKTALGRKLMIDLTGTRIRLSLRGVCDPECGGKIHLDANWKVLSILVYLNQHPLALDDPLRGGNLRLLTGPKVKQTAQLVESYNGTLLAFRNSKHAWHGFTPYSGERRAIQINYERPSLVPKGYYKMKNDKLQTPKQKPGNRAQPSSKKPSSKKPRFQRPRFQRRAPVPVAVPAPAPTQPEDTWEFK